MRNPLGLVKQTRKNYNKELRRVVMEVQVDLEGIPKTWMPLEMLVALVNLNPNQNDRKAKTNYSEDAD
jgi:hypothetical protein